MNTARQLVSVALVALAFTASPPAKAGYVTGQDLLSICSPQRADPVYRLKVAQCRGYVVAIADTADCSRKNIEFRWNSATNASQHQLVDTVVGWLEAHPALLTYQADGLVAAALADQYPCNAVTASGTGQ